MNTLDFKRTLLNISQENPTNKIAKIFAVTASSLNFTNKESLFENILNIYENDDLKDLEITKDSAMNEAINIDDYKDKDFRIRNLFISNLRGFPDLNETDSIPYGINFSNGQDIESLLILANNGTGKSSIFNALEFVYTNKIGEKAIRAKSESISNAEFEQYLQRFQSETKPFFEIETVSGKFNLDKRIFPEDIFGYLNPKSHFISENDIITSGKNNYSSHIDYSFHNTIAKNLGLEEYINFSNRISTLNNYKRKKESNARNALLNELNLQNDSVKARVKELNEIDEKIKNFNVTDVDDTISNQPIIDTAVRLNKRTLVMTGNLDKVANSIVEFNKNYNRFILNTDNVSHLNEVSFLENGMTFLDKYKGCPFCLNSHLTLSQITEHVSKRITNIQTSASTEYELKDHFKTIVLSIIGFLDSVNNIYDIISEERNIAVKFKEFDELSKLEANFTIAVSAIISDEEQYSFFKTLSDQRLLDNKVLAQLYNYVSKNPTFIKYFINLHEEIILFIETRNVFLNNILLSFNDDASRRVSLNLENLNKQKVEVERSMINLNELIKKNSIELNFINKKVESINDLKKDLRNFLILFNKKKDELVLSNFNLMKENVESLINEFIDEDVRLEINLEKYEELIDDTIIEVEYIVAKVLDIHSGKKTTPDIYFNTFRFKLFNLIINLSMALAVRKKYNLNLPLVIDDVFYSSDFANKVSFTSFLKNVLVIFNKHTPEIPLQIILLTHDDTIFTSAIESFDSIKSHIYNFSADYRITRMFKLSDRDEVPSTINGKKYWNIIYSLDQIYTN